MVRPTAVSPERSVRSVRRSRYWTHGSMTIDSRWRRAARSLRGIAAVDFSPDVVPEISASAARRRRRCAKAVYIGVTARRAGPHLRRQEARSTWSGVFAPSFRDRRAGGLCADGGRRPVRRGQRHRPDHRRDRRRAARRDGDRHQQASGVTFVAIVQRGRQLHDAGAAGRHLRGQGRARRLPHRDPARDRARSAAGGPPRLPDGGRRDPGDGRGHRHHADPADRDHHGRRGDLGQRRCSRCR